MQPMSSDTPCNVCRGTEFVAGPNGRISRTGKPPRCTGCGSLERHRQLRQVYGQLPAEYLAGLDVLQLSPDVGVDPGWFGTYEVSVYGSENSLDLEQIDRPDDRYDLVICNHVLEHVADDRKGLVELMRVVRADGLVQLTVPSPHTREHTVDWGYPREEAHGHYRGYGREIIELFGAVVPDGRVLEVKATDAVTGVGGYVYLWTASNSLSARMRNWIGSPIKQG